MRKFKVGDRVKIRQWDDMFKEFGGSKDYYIDTPCSFVSGMRDFCGQIGTITSVETLERHQKVKVKFDNGDYRGWKWDNGMFELISDEKIVITAKGKTVTAKLYSDNKLTKTATAKCSPDDVYNFEFGAKLAMDRLMSDAVEVGDKVEVTDWGELHSGYDEWVTTNASKYAVYYAYYADALYNAECEIPNIEGELKVVAKAMHGTALDCILCLIQDTEAKTCFLIDEKALKKIQ